VAALQLHDGKLAVCDHRPYGNIMNMPSIEWLRTELDVVDNKWESVNLCFAVMEDYHQVGDSPRAVGPSSLRVCVGVTHSCNSGDLAAVQGILLQCRASLL